MESAVRYKRWTREEYARLIAVGLLHEDEPIELIDGALRVAEPQGSPHMAAIGLAADALREAFGPGWIVRVQGPIALDDCSEPEPDLAVVRGTHRDFAADHPSRPALVVEVAESSLVSDRGDKGGLYARGGLADYWLVNLVDRRLEVYREPVPDPAAPFGWRYASCALLGPDAAATPLAIPDTAIRVADLLP